MPEDDASFLLCAEDAFFFVDAATASTCTTAEQIGGWCSGAEEESAAASFVAELIGGEADYSPRSDYSDRLRSRSVDPAARADSVAWTLKVQEYYGFLPLTAYLAVNYMDRFLSLHRLPVSSPPGARRPRPATSPTLNTHISPCQTTMSRAYQITSSCSVSFAMQEDGWAMQLLAVTCLSLAAKMEETLVPSLLDLQIESTRYIFEPRTILRMELLVLTALNWRLRSVTPFTFIDFFACKVDPRGRHMRYLIARATQIILAAIHDIEFLDHCPSSMAAAAVLCAAGETPSLTLLNPRLAVNWCIGLAEEGVSSCYQLMQQLVGGKRAKTTAAAAVNLCSDEVLSCDSSSCTTPPPPKRRKRSPPPVIT
ncbi:cyclin-D2-1 isoform X1 [Aegilops tauschii subsp. strangulata]|nr:cyclin-D2-1 isoform X1 [Aegilops tauschii subsp. strangulata]